MSREIRFRSDKSNLKTIMKTTTRSAMGLVAVMMLSFLTANSVLATDYGIYWRPPLLPFVIKVGTKGISISGDASICTPLGTFGLEISKDIIRKQRPTTVRGKRIEQQDLILVIRDRHNRADRLFKIKNGSNLSVLTDGETLITATKGCVIVDVHKGNIRRLHLADGRSSGFPISRHLDQGYIRNTTDRPLILRSTEGRIYQLRPGSGFYVLPVGSYTIRRPG